MASFVVIPQRFEENERRRLRRTADAVDFVMNFDGRRVDRKGQGFFPLKNYVFHLVSNRGAAAPSEPLLPIVGAAPDGGDTVSRNDLLLIFKLPSTEPNAAVVAVFDAKKRGWSSPIDQLSFFLNRTEDVFRIDWSERRLLTRSTFDALRDWGKIERTDAVSPYYDARTLDENRAATVSSASTAATLSTASPPSTVRSSSAKNVESFEYLAIGDFDAFLAVDDRRYFGSQTLSVETFP